MKYLILTILTVFSTGLFAQETDEITDDELKRYAIAKDSVDRMTDLITETLKEMVANTEAITPSRYNDLYKISKNEEKLAEAEATDMEIEFLQQVDHYKDSMTAEIKSTFTTLAKDFVGDGGRVYNKITRALKSDEEVKARYEEIFNSLREEVAEEEEEEETSSTGSSGN